MAKIVLHKLDRFINIFSLLLLVGGGMIIHTLTALTLSSYYGDLWGYVSFLLPGIAETYLVSVQLGDNMYNYSIILALFAAMALIMTLILLCKNYIRTKIESTLAKRTTLPSSYS